MSPSTPVLDHPLFAAFFQASPDMIFIHGPDGRLVDVNPQVERVTGYSREEILAAPPQALMGEGCEEAEAFERLARAREGEAQDFLWMARARSGEEFPVEVRLRSLSLGGETYVLALVRDLRLQRDHQEAHQRRREILRRIAAAERESVDPDRILPRVIDALREMFQADRAYLVYPCDPEAESWSVPVQAAHPDFHHTPGGTYPYTPYTRRLAREFLQADGAVPVYPGEADREWGAEEYQIRSGLVVAVRPRRGRPWLLGVHQCTYRREWTQTEQALLTELAERIAPLLDNIAEQRERFAQDSRLHHYQHLLAELARHDPGQAPDLHAALWPYTEAGARALNVGRVSVWLLDGNRQTLTCVDLFQDGVHRRGERLRAADFPVYFAALATGRALAAADARQDLRTRDFLRAYLLPNDIGAMLDVPIRVGGGLVGVLCCEHQGGPRPWPADEQGFAASLADQVALVVDHWRRREEEQALLRRARVGSSILRVLPMAYALIDPAGVVREANPAFSRLCGVAETLAGRELGRLAGVGADLADLCARGGEGVLHLTGADGVVRSVQASTADLPEAGEGWRVLFLQEGAGRRAPDRTPSPIPFAGGQRRAP